MFIKVQSKLNKDNNKVKIARIKADSFCATGITTSFAHTFSMENVSRFSRRVRVTSLASIFHHQQKTTRYSIAKQLSLTLIRTSKNNIESTMPSLTRTAWCILCALGYLSVANSSGDSLNVDLEVVENVDLSNLGVEGLPAHAGKYELTVTPDCYYTLRVEFKEHSSDNMLDTANRQSFLGDCDKVLGAFLHKYNRNWMQFKQYVQDTTGFDHWSMYPRPCGMEPLGRRQPRYDVNFYTADSHHRAVSLECTVFRFTTS